MWKKIANMIEDEDEPPSATSTEGTLSADEEEDEDDKIDVCSLPECDSDLLGKISVLFIAGVTIPCGTQLSSIKIFL